MPSREFQKSDNSANRCHYFAREIFLIDARHDDVYTPIILHIDEYFIVCWQAAHTCVPRYLHAPTTPLLTAYLQATRTAAVYIAVGSQVQYTVPPSQTARRNFIFKSSNFRHADTWTVKLKFHGTDTDTDFLADFRARPVRLADLSADFCPTRAFPGDDVSWGCARDRTYARARQDDILDDRV